MGRGRAKAKQTRVARELKYHSPNTDLAALQRELAGSGKSDQTVDDDYDDYDEYDQYADEADPEADEQDRAPGSGRSAPRR
jgi:hypothetical protein